MYDTTHKKNAKANMMSILSVVSRCPYLFKSFSDWVKAPLAFLISLSMLETVDEDFTGKKYITKLLSMKFKNYQILKKY